MTWLVERLAELRRHLEHLKALAPRVPGAESLERDLSLHNDVLFSLLTVCQLVIDIAGELAGRRGQRFENYTDGFAASRPTPAFQPTWVQALVPLAGFRNVVIHEYVALDMQRVVEAVRALAPIERFLAIAAALESDTE